MTSERLTRDTIYRQLSEMWAAISDCGDTSGKAASDGRRVERDLLARLEAQDRLDNAASDLLTACQNALPILEKYIEEAGPCEHGVNICVCGIRAVLDQVRAAIRRATG